MSGRDNGEANSGHAGQRGSTCVRAGTRLCCSLKGAGVKRAAAGTRAGERKGGRKFERFLTLRRRRAGPGGARCSPKSLQVTEGGTGGPGRRNLSREQR